MLTANTENHSRVRRLFSPAFSERALRQQEPLFRKYVDLLMYKISEVGEEGRKPVEMGQLLNFATFDVMAELCFGQPLGLLAKNEYSPWVKSIFESLKMLPIASMINYYPILNAIFTRFEPKSVTEQRVTHCKHSEERVNQRLQNGSDQPDVWNLVLAAKEGKGLTLEEMHSNAELFMLAGSETTGTYTDNYSPSEESFCEARLIWEKTNWHFSHASQRMRLQPAFLSRKDEDTAGGSTEQLHQVG